MTALLLAMTAAQAFSVTIPAHSQIVRDGQGTELPTCTTVVNNGTLVLLMPDGSRFVDDATSQANVTVRVADDKPTVPATQGAARVLAAYAADAVRNGDVGVGRNASIRISYPTRRGRRTIADVTVPLRSSSDILSGGWRNASANSYLDGETLSLITDGSAPSVRYTRGGMFRNWRGRIVPGTWTVETPIATGTTSAVSTVYLGGYYRRVRMDVTIGGR